MNVKAKLLTIADLDGTVYGNDFQLSALAVTTVKRLQKLAGEFIIATGNPLMGKIHDVAREFNLRYIIASSGAGIYDFANQNYIRALKVSRPIIKELTKLAAVHNAEVFYWNETAMYVGAVKNNIRMHRFETELKFNLQPITDEVHDAFKLEYYGAIATISKLHQIISNDQNYRDLDVVLMDENHLEITCADANKGAAVTWLANRLNVPLDAAMAIGDSANDISMLKCVGYSYAMDNAPAEIKQIAKHHAADVMQDGFALAVDDYIYRRGYR